MTDGMVEIRAVVRREMLDRVVRMLKEAGVPRLTVTRVHAIGAGVDPAMAKLSLDEGSDYADKALVQFVCGGDRCTTYTELIIRAARTGRQGDGIVYVQPVVAVTKIRTGQSGLTALR
ncbi:MAG: P-II family nitrogen regulator [Micromonosporaceae bacterium]